ncbi:hypothetical protein [Arthrobacter sp. ISL-69]|uniref:hypothetical protein n=1 Tax=Arthrobacter sp. ISL-69 TaxID=2819113 RepID=UPI001BE92287|nr:hypothetical protein [Arthrobacter sp. ISL-69]MBT2537186.1 hypothetical protein [Arthrobacter sp. ISL-69]
MRQLITPNPDIPCKPGWCLAYVNEAFGVPKRFGSATDAWFGSTTQHRNRNFPAGVWTPVWYGLDTTPLGHVVLLAPDGSVYSTSDLTNTPHHHPHLADLEAYYAYYGMTLTYRGWTEDVEGTPVIGGDGLAYMGETITPTSEEDDMAYTPAELKQLVAEGVQDYFRLKGEFQDGRNAIDHLNQIRTDVVSAKTVAMTIPQAVLFDTKVDGRNLFDSIKQVRTDLFGTRGNIDIPALAKELASQLEATDIAALAAQLQITVKEG